jgi:RNA polymerase sigma-70 factor (ECF subfamily)
VIRPPPTVGRDLVASLKAGDEEAFMEMVRLCQRRVINTAWRILGNLDEAREVSQDVFVKVFEAIGALREEDRFEAWLLRITVNHCRNRWKYLKRRYYFRSEPLDPVDGEEEVERQIPDPSDDPGRQLERKRRDAWVQKALLALKEDHRELVVLRDVQGYSYEEIGEAVGLPEGTVKSRLHRARMELKDLLERSGQLADWQEE